ncbi:MAG: Arm DNA-binding domain-containing protein [Methylococcales bacterium]
MPLTDTTIKNAKPTPDKSYKLPDEKGMYLLVNPNGSKYFRLKYRFVGKEKVLALGVYPETNLRQARDKRDVAKKQLADGIDPSITRKEVKAEQHSTAESEKHIDAGLPAIDSFEFIALEWYDKRMLGKSESHQKRTLSLLKRDLFPWLGNRPIIGKNTQWITRYE